MKISQLHAQVMLKAKGATSKDLDYMPTHVASYSKNNNNNKGTYISPELKCASHQSSQIV